MTPRTLPALANAIAGWFPELNGRALAVSEVRPFSDKTNIPTLPLAIVALLSEKGNATKNGINGLVTTSEVLIQFVYTSHKYKDATGTSDTPFYAFYDYESVRDRLLTGLQNWRSPRKSVARFDALDVESDEYAVYISIKIMIETKWCDQSSDTDPCIHDTQPVTNITFGLCAPKSDCCNDNERGAANG
jgi:hypothetical protein